MTPSVRLSDTHCLVQRETAVGSGFTAGQPHVAIPLLGQTVSGRPGLIVQEVPFWTKPATNAAAARQRFRRQLYGIQVAVTLSTPLWPDCAAEIFAWAGEDPLPSLAIHIVDPIGDREYVGARLDLLDLSADTTGDPVLQAIRFKALGGGTAGALGYEPSYGDSVVGFAWRNATLEYGGEEIEAQSLMFRVDNRIRFGPFGSDRRPGILLAGKQEVQSSVLLPYDGTRYEVSLREGSSAAYSATFGHAGSDTNGLVALAVPQAIVMGAPWEWEDDLVVRQRVTLEAFGGSAGQWVATVGDRP